MSAQLPGCPFYGRRWPERSPLVRAVGGNECGLDFDGHGPCIMELQGRNVDYFSCPLALDHSSLLAAARYLISFEKPSGSVQLLGEWEASAKR